MTKYVLDTNIVAAVLRKNPKVLQHFKYFTANSGNVFLACPLVYYEVRRGLLRQDARKQMADFEEMFQDFVWEGVERTDWHKAADLWVQRIAMGRPIEDSDLLIAVFALNRDAVLVTNNTKDFEHLGVRLEDWTV